MATLDELSKGTWTLDPAHTEVGFSVRHAGISKTRGVFSGAEGTLTKGDTLADTTLEVTLPVDSIDTRNEGRDQHLKSADFFDVEQFPTGSFKATSVSGESVTGDLTLHGVTKPVTLTTEFAGESTDPFGAHRAGFSATTKLSRKEFGLTWNAALETGGVLVGDDVTIEIEAEFTLA